MWMSGTFMTLQEVFYSTTVAALNKVTGISTFLTLSTPVIHLS